LTDSLHQIAFEYDGAIRLNKQEQELLTAECALLLQQPLPAPARTVYQALEDAAAEGSVPASLQDSLQALLEVGLESGRIRAVHTAHGEMAANRLYARLPRGKLYRKSVEAANEALKTLEGQSLFSASFQARGPGSCTLILDTGDRRITIGIKRSGVSVENVEATV